MFKVALLLIASATLAVARPGYLHGHHHHYPEYPLLHHHHEPLHVAKIVHVPAAISHQSSTIIHSPAHHIIKPIVVPVVKTVVHPVIKAYHPAPIIKAYHPLPPLHVDPFYHHHFDHPHFDHHDFHHYP